MIILIPIMLVYGLFSMTGLIMIWGKHKTIDPVGLKDPVSIVIAVKNEEKGIGKLLDQILKSKINVPFELVIVDDGSSDNTLNILNDFSQNNPQIKVLQNPKSGKKSAIELAIKNCKNEAIVQTDGDCEVGEYWLLSMVNSLMTDERKLVIGPVYPIITKSAVNPFVRLEWLGIQFLTAFTAMLKKPALANGANMAFFKSDYLAFCNSGLGKKYASGDDAFFLKFIAKMGKSVFNLDKFAIVKTAMPDQLGALITQRIRWATKAGKTGTFLSYLFSTIVAMANFAWIAGIVFVIEDYHNLPLLIITMGWKFISDVVICWNMSRFYDDQKSLLWLPVLFFLNPIYMALGLLLSFKRSYTWKGVKMK